MRPRTWLILIVQAALVSLVVFAVGSRRIPLGVPGEWEWLRSLFPPLWQWLGIAGLGGVAYALFVALGYNVVAAKGSPGVEARWLTALGVAAIAIQAIIPLGAASGYDHS